MVGAELTSSAVMVPSARSESRCATLSRRLASSLGSALKMPPGDLPVTIAHVAKVTRSAASRGGTSASSASATACWLSTGGRGGQAAPVPPPRSAGAAGRPRGSVGGGGMLAALGSAGAASESGSATWRLRLRAWPPRRRPGRLGSRSGGPPRRACLDLGGGGRPAQQFGLSLGDLLGAAGLLELAQLRHLVAMLDRILMSFSTL